MFSHRSFPAFCAATLLFSSSALGQTVASGAVGRVIVASEIADAKVWPVDKERQASLVKPANIRRPTGHGPVAQFFEPNPALTVAIVGAKGEPNPTELHIAGAQFSPAQLVASVEHAVKIINDESAPRTILYQGESLKVGPGETRELVLKGAGVQTLKIQELPFASATVKLLKSCLFLEVNDAGTIAQTAIDPGDYRLVFFHGARKLLEQELAIQTSAYVAIDATVSANAVVTVSLKEGVQVAPVRKP